MIGARAPGSRLRLERPSAAREAAFQRFAEDFRAAGEAELHERYRPGLADFERYCEALRANEWGRELPDGWVPASTRWLLDGEDLVAAVRIRHRLDAFLEEHGGHVGYDVAPSWRGRGHGRRALELGLLEAATLALPRVLLIADADNTASLRIIERCGGRLLDERTVPGERMPLRRYWIEVPRALELRPPRPPERGFVDELLVAACFPPARPAPTPAEALAWPHSARWLRPPVGPADVAVVAVLEGRPVGAAVGRCFAAADASWGVIAPDVPELAMAIVPDQRGRGVGETLLRAWIGAAAAAGHRACSLTVSLANPAAWRLYQRAGFRAVERDERRMVMRLELGA